MNRLNRSLDNLLETLQELQRERDRLAAALTHIIRGVSYLNNCDVLKSPEELLEHISEYESVYIILTNVSNLPLTIAATWDDIQDLEKEGRLESWIRSYWSPNTQAISISPPVEEIG
ncbi:MAG: hypothetical protein ACOX0F_13715 [Syntrophomonadaceae bacterium]|jgi:hypothetical protein